MPELAACGAINWDVSCFVEHLPAPGEEVVVKRITRVSGGTGGNTAVAAARILGPGQVGLIGALGDDDIAGKQISALAAEGVMTSAITCVAGEESGQAHILVDREGQNTIASHLGANARLGPEHLHDTSVQDLLQKCQGIVLTDPPLDVIAELAAMANGRAIPLFWDPGILTNYGWEILEPFVRQTDTLFLNEAEASALFAAGDTAACLRHLRGFEFPKRIVLKRGHQGAVMLERSTNILTEIPALPIKGLGLNIVNTVGCGDVFAGAFAAYRVLGGDMRRSLIMASVAAGLNATRFETRGCPDRATLETTEKGSRKLGFVAETKPC
jgi:ribokinase